MSGRRLSSIGLVVLGLAGGARTGAAQAPPKAAAPATSAEASDQKKKVTALLDGRSQEYLACGSILDLAKSASPSTTPRKSKPTLAELTADLNAQTRQLEAMNNVIACRRKIFDSVMPELQKTGAAQPLIDETIKEWAPKPKEHEAK